MSLSPERQLRESRLEQIRDDAQEQLRSEPVANESREVRKDTATSLQPVAEAGPRAGYYGMPLLKSPAWSWEIPLYFFAGGAAGASALLVAVGTLTHADRKLIRDARWLAAIGGVISPALLIADLGVPSRFLNMMRVFKVQSPMSVGSWTLMAFSSSSAASAVLARLERRRRFNRIPVLTRSADMVAALSGLVLATYTGVLVGATAIPAWNQNVRMLPVHFAASGLSSAVSLLELRGHRTAALNKIGIGAAAFETAVGAALEFGRNPATEPLHHGPTGWTMRAAGLLSGPLTLALRLLSLTASRPRRAQFRKAAALSSLAGSLITRWAWVYAGRTSAKDPTVPLELPAPPRSDTHQLASDN